MKIVKAEPPLIDLIDAAFKVRGRPILFAFGDVIYNPMGVDVPPELVAHEMVHGDRQATYPGGVLAWWGRYLVDTDFRLREEIPAHVAEYISMCERHKHKWTNQRNMRRLFAAEVARKLAAPLYGNLITVDEAKRALMSGAAA